MKTLVTGAPGWLGTRLVEILREKGRQVKCLVLPEADDFHLRELGVEIFKGDLTKPKTLKGICKEINTVFHCAGIIHPRRISEFYKINFEGTKNILKEAIGLGVRKFIYVSSNSVGGSNTFRDRLMVESDPPRPYRHYGLSKYMAEEIVQQAFREGKIDTTIIRPCWFYGIRQPERQTKFFRMIKKGNILIFGNGNNLRSMSYIDNVIQALLLAEEKEISAGKIYWVADKDPYPVVEIYSSIAKLLGVSLRLYKVPVFLSRLCIFLDALIQGVGFYSKEIHVAGEMSMDITCSIKKAQEELNYCPTIELEEGLRKSIEWCRVNGYI
nr:hypothetical protein [Nanoarchaeum sp.]